MSTYPNILNKIQIKEFETPPIFRVENRKIFFDIPKIKDIIFYVTFSLFRG